MRSSLKCFSNKGIDFLQPHSLPVRIQDLKPIICLVSEHLCLSEDVPALKGNGTGRHCIKDEEGLHFGGWQLVFS